MSSLLGISLSVEVVGGRFGDPTCCDCDLAWPVSWQGMVRRADSGSGAVPCCRVASIQLPCERPLRESENRARGRVLS